MSHSFSYNTDSYGSFDITLPLVATDAFMVPNEEGFAGDGLMAFGDEETNSTYALGSISVPQGCVNPLWLMKQSPVPPITPSSIPSGSELSDPSSPTTTDHAESALDDPKDPEDKPIATIWCDAPWITDGIEMLPTGETKPDNTWDEIFAHVIQSSPRKALPLKELVRNIELLYPGIKGTKSWANAPRHTLSHGSERGRFRNVYDETDKKKKWCVWTGIPGDHIPQNGSKMKQAILELEATIPTGRCPNRKAKIEAKNRKARAK